MFETTGNVNITVLKEFGHHLLPDVQKLLFKWMAIFFLCAGIVCMPLEFFQFAAIMFYLAFAFTVCYFITRIFLTKLCAKLTMKRLSESVNSDQCSYTTTFEEDGVHIINNTLAATVVIRYINLKKLVETKNYYLLLTKSMQFTVIFKSCLDAAQMEQFLPFLKDRCPKLKTVVTDKKKGEKRKL